MKILCMSCDHMFSANDVGLHNHELPLGSEVECPECDTTGTVAVRQENPGVVSLVCDDTMFAACPYDADTNCEFCPSNTCPRSGSYPGADDPACWSIPCAICQDAECEARKAATKFCNEAGPAGCDGCPQESAPVCVDTRIVASAKGVEHKGATPQGGNTMKAIEKLCGDLFAVTSIGIALNVGDGDFKALRDGRIKTSRTALPIDSAFYLMQVPADKVVVGDFLMVDGQPLAVKKAEADEMLVVNLVSGEQKTILPEETPDGLKFLPVIRTSIPAAIIDKMVAGTLSTTQMLLVSGDKSVDQLLAMKLVAENDDIGAEELALFQQARRDI